MPKAIGKEQAETAAYQPDEKDIAILKLLQQNARITVKEVADAVHLSTTPVHERIKRMEVAGIIKQYATLLDHTKVNKPMMVICYVSIKEHSKTAGAKFIEMVNALPEIVECYSISGEFDFLLKVMAASMDDYYHFHVNKLSQIENMGHVQSVFVMGIIKQTHVLV
jgi:Lrp/AsnC family transcriptional regulator, leucine-responsive regulatory protein